jgi:hypothetical protein
MADIFCMHPYLVGAPGMNFKFNKGLEILAPHSQSKKVSTILMITIFPFKTGCSIMGVNIARLMLW